MAAYTEAEHTRWEITLSVKHLVLFFERWSRVQRRYNVITVHAEHIGKVYIATLAKEIMAIILEDYYTDLDCHVSLCIFNAK